MTDTKPNCYECRYRQRIPGSAHSRCTHPEVGELTSAQELVGILASVGRLPPLVTRNLAEAVVRLGIKANSAGIRGGWFNWPVNFDPVWLLACNGFMKKTEGSDKDESGEIR